MPLDPQAQKVLDATAALGLPPTEQMTPAEARESMRSRTAALGPVEDVARVDDHRVPVDGGTITVRCYTPAGRGPFPAYVYFHGGGWVIGDIETHDGICRSLANASGSVVASVDYRLAPEHKYPVAAEDAYAATQWVAREAGRLGVDGRRLAVGGDSAGGNLAAAVCLMSRDRSGPALALQVLAYPVTQYNLDTRSYREYADGLPAHAEFDALVLGPLPPAPGGRGPALRLSAVRAEAPWTAGGPHHHRGIRPAL